MSRGGPPTILLTGASGFIGGAVATRLAGAGQQVRCLVRASSDTRRLLALAAQDPKLTLIRGDITDRDCLAAAVVGVDAVINCAAMVSDWGTVAEIRAANTVAAADLAVFAARAGVRRFIQISTTDVYGHPGGRGIGETQPTAGFANWYAQSKTEAESLLLEISADSGLELVLLRPSTVYGPGSRDVVGELASALCGGYLPLIGGGGAIAGLLYVDNLVDAVITVLSRAEAAGETYNVSDEIDVTWAGFLSDLARGLDCRPPRLRVATSLALAAGVALEEGYRRLRRLSGLHSAPLLSRQAVQVLAVNQDFSAAKLRTTLGWQPRVGYAEGLASTLTWLRQEHLRAA